MASAEYRSEAIFTLNKEEVGLIRKGLDSINWEEDVEALYNLFREAEGNL
jgi:hypothetical protein